MTENMVTIQGINGEFTLARWQVEAAYKHQLHEYTLRDAKSQLSYYLEGYRYSEGGTFKVPTKVTEEDYESMALKFLEQYDYDIDDNTKWLGIIERHFRLPQ